MTIPVVTLIIDDHVVVREGICRALEIRTGFEIFQAASKAEAYAQIAHLNPTLIIVDINLPDGSGLEIITWVRSLSQTTAIIVLTFNESDEYILAAMKSGASAYVNKGEPLPDLIASIEHALTSPSSFSARDMSGALARRVDHFGLSERELQILTILHRGEPLKELAKSLFITESTLKTHLSTIYRKLDVKSRVQAIEKAKKAGLT